MDIFPGFAVARRRPKIVDELVSGLSEESTRLLVVLEVVAQTAGYLAPGRILRGHGKRDGTAAEIHRRILSFIVAVVVAADEVVEPLGERGAGELQLLGILFGRIEKTLLVGSAA